jgi:hypothetical protein
MDDPDDVLPEDCIFTYKVTASYLMTRYGQDVVGQLRMGQLDADSKYQMLEYVSADAIQLVIMGQDDDPSLSFAQRSGVPQMILEEIPNRTGRPLVVMPQRITLDKPRGQFDGILGMYYTRARLQALTEIAIERGIFPEEYLVARPGENPVIVQVADGKKGQLGVVKGGDIQQNQIIKIFTVASVLFMPPTLIASIYGMNVGLPSQHQGWAFVMVMLIIVLSAIVPIWFFKRKRLL